MTTSKVTMRNEIPGEDGTVWVHEAVDPKVPAEILDEYVEDARTRWDSVTVEPNQE